MVPRVLLYTYQAFKMRISGFRVDYNVCLSRAPFVALNAKEDKQLRVLKIEPGTLF